MRFLQVDPSAENAVSPMAAAAAAAGARFELRDGWRVVAGYGDEAAERRRLSEAVGFADLSHLGKLELYGGPAGELGSARLDDDGAWWCPLTPERQLVLVPTAATAATREALEGCLDVTAGFGALVIAGPAARETFARFCALDLRERVLPVGGFRPGSVARTPGFVLRQDQERFLVLFGAAYGEYLWQVVADAAGQLGGGPVGVDALEAVVAGA